MSNEALHYLEEIAGGVIKRPNEVQLVAQYNSTHNSPIYDEYQTQLSKGFDTAMKTG